MDYDGDCDIDHSLSTWNNSKSPEKRMAELEIWRWIDTVQSTTMIRAEKILRQVLEIWKESLLLRLQYKKYQLELVNKTFQE